MASNDTTVSLNPLHCGAVVASGWTGGPAAAAAIVSIPFIAGQWSLLEGDPFAIQPCPLQVSIPFIAGQWSLLEAPSQRRRERPGGLNPLHCGAVVAS